MSIRKVGQWGQAARILNAYSTRFGAVVDQAVKREALRYEIAMKEGIKDQAPGGVRFKPISLFTRLRKRSSKALIDRGDLRNSIGTRRITSKAYFAGLHRTAMSRDGESLVNIGAVHEFGADFKQTVTAKQAKFFLAMAMKGMWMPGVPKSKDEVFASIPKEGDVINIRTPARPFVAPVFEKLSPGASKRVMDDVLKGIGIASRL